VKRDRMLGILNDAGFRCFKPAAAYYIMTDISDFGFPDDLSFSRYLVEKIGIAVVPGSSFYDDPSQGASQVRFTFARRSRHSPLARRNCQSSARASACASALVAVSRALC